MLLKKECKGTFVVVDEMHIRQLVEWNGKTFEGFVNCGTSLESNTDATSALVFMAVSLNGHWKIPLGYFLIKSCNAETRSNLLSTCLKLLYETGAECYSITFDGAQVNIAMCTKLGASYDLEDFRPWILHPITSDKVFTFFNACHMLKLCRNTIGDFELLYNSKSNVIKWDLLKRLCNLQEVEGLQAGNKLNQRHIEYQNEKMNVKFGAQTLSNSVASALLACKEIGLPGFLNVEDTAEFCNNINDYFDILNSRNFFSKYKYNEPLSIRNYEISKNRIDY